MYVGSKHYIAELGLVAIGINLNLVAELHPQRLQLPLPPLRLYPLELLQIRYAILNKQGFGQRSDHVHICSLASENAIGAYMLAYPTYKSY